MADYDHRRVISILGGDVKVEDGETLKLFIVPDAAPGFFRFSLKGADHATWKKANVKSEVVFGEDNAQSTRVPSSLR